VRDAELERLFRRCPELSDDERKLIEQTVDRLVGKFMHPCVATLRRHSLTSTDAGLNGVKRAAEFRLR
jgi:glutamyl-tRNA reductase